MPFKMHTLFRVLSAGAKMKPADGFLRDVNGGSIAGADRRLFWDAKHLKYTWSLLQ